MDIIKLRGHHLSVLAEYVADRELTKETWDETGWLCFSDFISNTYDSVINNPEARIEVVGGMDDILCSSQNPGCRQKKESCLRTDQDDFCNSEYGLAIGDVLTSGELMQRIAEYRQKTGYANPKAKMIDFRPGA